MTENIQGPNTLSRKIPEGHKVIDLSLRGEMYRWVEQLKRNRILQRALGVTFIENPESRVIITTPHGQQGVTVFDPQEISRESLIEDKTPPRLSKYPRIGKAVNEALAPSAKATSGMGDSLSQQLGMETAKRMLKRSDHLPNIVSPTLSEATLNTNSGLTPKDFEIIKGTLKTDRGTAIFGTLTFGAKPEHVEKLRTGTVKLVQKEFSNRKDYTRAMASLLAVKMVQAFRRKLIEFSIRTPTDKLILDLHTAYNRENIREGSPVGTNANVEIVIGTRHGLICDLEVEVLLARFLAKKGFGVVETSFFPIPDPDTRYPKRPKLKPREAYEGEEARTEEFFAWAKRHKVSRREFEDDAVLRGLGRLRGLKFPHVLRQKIASESSIKANIIQLEVVRKVMENDFRRKQLAETLAEFSGAFEAGVEGLRSLNQKYNLRCESFLVNYKMN